jgi:23S rRNA (uracil1939-C5)-methyltransferase
LDNSFSCRLFSKCSGCKSQSNVRNPEVWGEICEFLEKHSNLTPKLISKEITGWRSKAKLAVRGTFKNPQIGLFEQGSHKVVDLIACPMHYPEIDEAVQEVRKEVIKYKIEPYEEKSHTGCLRYLQMHVSRETSKIQLVLVFNAVSLKESERAFVKGLYTSGMFHSIWANYLDSKTNSIFGSAWKLLEGEEDFFQKIRGISFAFHPSCFSQAHLSLFDDLVSYVDSLVPKEKNVLELYSGVGCIGLSLASRAKKVTLVESSPHAESSLKKTLKSLVEEDRVKCCFLSSRVEEMDVSLHDVDVVLVDPPRKGLSVECKKKVFDSSAKQLVYISCGYDSFMRDCIEILEKGWKLEESRGFLLFPGTNHVEIVASFRKL